MIHWSNYYLSNLDNLGDLMYIKGLGGHLESEATKDSLPKGQNSPQECPHGLWAEQLNGSAFTVGRASNFRSWLYRMQPSVNHSEIVKIKSPKLYCKEEDCVLEAKQLRWDPLGELNGNEGDFFEGLATLACGGRAEDRHGVAIYSYKAKRGMGQRALSNSDGDWLIVPQRGELQLQSEFGILLVKVGEIAVVQRGMRFKIDPVAKTGAEANTEIGGFILEVFDSHFELPDLGPIGSNGLANPQDFLFPRAYFDPLEHSAESAGSWTVITKFGGDFYEAHQHFSPFNVVAWRGNYLPFKYDLALFNTVNTVSFDHLDPSIFTVLTCKSSLYPSGTALADFVIFPPRWSVASHTFRPPYFHRNCMSEFMGLISGSYDAKKGGGFVAGGASLHSIMIPHGPDSESAEHAEARQLEPEWVGAGSLAFMFETWHFLKVSPWALQAAQADYQSVWGNFSNRFTQK